MKLIGIILIILGVIWTGSNLMNLPTQLGFVREGIAPLWRVILLQTFVGVGLGVGLIYLGLSLFS